jgi:MFS family permease
MTTNRRLLREQLLAVEPPSPDLRDRLQLEIQNMFVRKLSTSSRVFISVLIVFDLAAAALCGTLAVTEQNLPLIARIGLGTGVFFALAWVVLFAVLLRRGEMNIRRDSSLIGAMVWGFTLVMCILMVMGGAMLEDRGKGAIIILYALFFLISAAVYFLAQRIEAAQLNLTERLLRMELQLTDVMQGKKENA